MDIIKDILSVVDAPATIGVLWYVLRAIIQELKKSINRLHEILAEDIKPTIVEYYKIQESFVGDIHELREELRRVQDQLHLEGQRRQENQG